MLVLAYFIDLAGTGRWTLLCIVAYTVTVQGGLVSGGQCFLRNRERVGNSRWQWKTHTGFLSCSLPLTLGSAGWLLYISWNAFKMACVALVSLWVTWRYFLRERGERRLPLLHRWSGKSRSPVALVLLVRGKQGGCVCFHGRCWEYNEQREEK